MVKKVFLFFASVVITLGMNAQTGPRVKVRSGMLEGCMESGVQVFRGVPFAAPPVGNLRWKAPQGLASWKGVRPAKEFGPDPMQQNLFGDMNFCAKSRSEDCLYLNIWAPSKVKGKKYPVFIYFNGGGLMAGSGSEPRYAGMELAKKGIVAITANYREGIFGFFAHPQLSSETSYKGSGNYGFLDQVAAIQWVKDNITAFGGDPDKITICGESAGSMSVSALMASPLSRNLIHQAIGSSGSVLSGKNIPSLDEAEKQGLALAESIGKTDIKDLRAMSAEDLMKKADVKNIPTYNVDNYFFPEQPIDIYKRGEQAKIPMLLGGNSAEMPAAAFLGGQPMTVQNLTAVAKYIYGDMADMLVSMYGIKNDSDIIGKPGYDFGSDIFLAYSTWKWGDVHKQTSGQPVYRYYYYHPRPQMKVKGKVAGLAGGVRDETDADKKMEKIGFQGAVHSADIEYAMGTLSTNTVFDWQSDDYKMSDIFNHYYANFIKTGNPNGDGLPKWIPMVANDDAPDLHLDVNTYMETDPTREARYHVIDLLKYK